MTLTTAGARRVGVLGVLRLETQQTCSYMAIYEHSYPLTSPTLTLFRRRLSLPDRQLALKRHNFLGVSQAPCDTID